jgi:hypothetical protein
MIGENVDTLVSGTLSQKSGAKGMFESFYNPTIVSIMP